RWCGSGKAYRAETVVALLRSPRRPRPYRALAAPTRGQQDGKLSGIGGKRLRSRGQIVDEPGNITADTHHLDTLATDTAAQGKLLDQPCRDVQVEIDVSIKGKAQVKDEIVDAEVVLGGDPAQPRG